MRPENRKSTSFKATGAQTRRLIQRDLGWIPGFPVRILPNGLEWRTTSNSHSGPTNIVIDRDSLKRATWTLRVLRNQHFGALKRCTADADGWLTRIEQILGVFKNCLQTRELPSIKSLLTNEFFSDRTIRRVQWLIREQPQATRLIQAAVYATVASPNRDEEQLLWLEKQADLVTGIFGLEHIKNEQKEELLVAALAMHEFFGAEIRELLFALSDLDFYECPLKEPLKVVTGLEREIRQRVDSLEVDSLPSRNAMDPTMGTIVLRIMCREEFTSKQRACALRLLHGLLERAGIQSLIQTQHRIKMDESRLLRTAKQLRNRRPVFVRGRAARKSFLKSNRSKLSGTKHCIRTLGVLDRAISLLDAPDQFANAPWQRLLRSLSREDLLLRLSVFLGWFDEMQGKAPRAVKQHVDCWAGWFERHGVPGTLRLHWQDTRRFGRDDFSRVLPLNVRADKKLWDQTVRLIQLVFFELQLSPSNELLAEMPTVLRAAGSVERALDLYSSLSGEVKPRLSSEDLLALFAFAPESQTNLGTAAESIYFKGLSQSVTALLPLAQHPRLGSLIWSKIESGDAAWLDKLAYQVTLIAGLEAKLPELASYERNRDWIVYFPAALHEELRELASVSPDAESIATGLLLKDFRPLYQVERELSFLQTEVYLVPDSRVMPLVVRLQNLKRRLEQRVEISDRRLDNLRSKLRARTEHEIVSRYLAACHQAIRTKLRCDFGISDLPACLLNDPMNQVLANIWSLNKAQRELGLQLVFRYLSTGTYAFDDAPRNRRFRRCLEEQGINMEPWLNDHVCAEAVDRHQVPYRVAFTRDVTDFLLMGYHFSTCLSPRDVNFYSTIANAVDVNKRVVYGKTESGRVIGRCLFALTSSGEILTYNCYAHNKDDGFEEAVVRFAEELTKQMQTRIASTGRVRRLVAKRWYDDGPVALLERCEFQRQREGLRAALRNEVPDVAVAKALAHFTPQQLKDEIRELFELPEIRDSPILRAGLFRYLVAHVDQWKLGWDNQILLCVEGKQAGLQEEAFALLKTIPVKRLLRRLRSCRCDDSSSFYGIGAYSRVFDLLTEYNPSLALRAIRWSRPDRSRLDPEDDNATRRYAFERAMSRLGRTLDSAS